MTNKSARRPGKRGKPARFGRGTRTGGPSQAAGGQTALADHYIYGLHAAEFALRHPERGVRAIWATENAERKLAEAIALRPLTVERVTPRDLDRRVGSDTVHQGIVLEVEPLATVDLEDLAQQALARGLPILVLDQVTDPHNVGAVLRSGAVFGAAGIVMTGRHSPPLGGTLAKAASGALDLMPVCLVQNLAKALEALKAQAFTVIGLDGEPTHQLIDEALAEHHGKPLVLALGAEGRGLRALTRETCDELCRIGGDGPIASLNVSNAAAVALHLASLQRRR